MDLKRIYTWTADVRDNHTEETTSVSGTVSVSAFSSQSRTEANAIIRGKYKDVDYTPTNIKLTSTRIERTDGK